MYVIVGGGGPLTQEYGEVAGGHTVPDTDVAGLQANRQQEVHNQVTLGTTAEELGYDCVYLSEHHLRMMSGASPNPLLVQAAIAQATTEIDLLQLSNILPWHEPVRLAEKIGTVDVLSDGRVQVGVGRGSTEVEAEVFGQYWGGGVANETRNIASFREKFDVLRKAWTEDLLSHHGEFHSVPPKWTKWDSQEEYRYLASDKTDHDPSDYFEVDMGETLLRAVTVFPQPAQDPYPQLWRPATSERAIRWSAEHGVNGVCLCREFEQVADMVDLYEEAAADAGWPDRRSEYDGDPFAHGWDDDRRRGLIPKLTVFNTEVATADDEAEFWTGREYLADVPDDTTSRQHARTVAENRDGVIVGDTDTIVERIHELRATVGYDDLGLLVNPQQAGMSMENVLTQLESFAEDVRPRLDA